MTIVASCSSRASACCAPSRFGCRRTDTREDRSLAREARFSPGEKPPVPPATVWGRRLHYQRPFIVLCSAFFLVACGGGGGSTSSTGNVIPQATPTPTPTPTSASVSQPVTASGGSASATLGTQTLTVSAPAGAFSGSATLKVTLESPSVLATTFAKARAAARTTQGVPSGATALAAFIVDDGGATLAAPLQVTLTGLAAPAAGQTVLISGFNQNAWDDVAGTTFSGNAYGETTNPHYPGITLAAATLYVIYTVPSGNVAAPAATVTVSGPATVSSGTQAIYTASETTANGFPFLGHAFTFAMNSSSAGTLTPNGVLMAGGVGGTANVTATDSAVAAFTGTLAIAISSARPGVSGLSEQYAGTLTEVDANDAIAGSPVSTTTASSTTLAVTAAADAADTSGGTTGVTFTANETDASNLTTLTSTTTSTLLYQPQANGSTYVRVKKVVTNESTGVVYEHDYGATNGLLTVLPEGTGTFNPANDASETYLETDPGVGVNGQVATRRVVNPDGSYTATFEEPNVNTGAPATDTATENTNFSGVLALNSVDPNAFTIQFAAPSGGNIQLSLIDPNTALDNVTTLPSYIPAANSVPSVETDTIRTGVGPPASCTNAATYPSANLITQTLSVVDAIFGTVETRTTSTYDVAGVGTVCTVVADTVNSFYDYSDQEGPFLISFAGLAGTPLLVTTMSEALSLQTTNAAQVQSADRTGLSAGTVATLPIAAFTAHVQHLAHQRALERLTAFRRNATRTLRGGSVK
jgi:hypothetical protein